MIIQIVVAQLSWPIDVAEFELSGAFKAELIEAKHFSGDASFCRVSSG